MLNLIQKNQTENATRDTILEKDMESKVARASADMERYRNDMYKYSAGMYIMTHAKSFPITKMFSPIIILFSNTVYIFFSNSGTVLSLGALLLGFYRLWKT